MTGGRFAGRSVQITGGNSGIGLTAARAFVAEGADVVISGRNRRTLDDAVAGLGARAAGVAADLARLDGSRRLVQAVMERHGRIDVLFANAGIARFGAIGTMTEVDWDEIMGANLKDLYFTVQQALPLIGRGGAIVLNASVAGSIGAPDCSIYSASKPAVQSLSRSLGAELVGAGILAPQAVAEMKKAWAAGDPMHRLDDAQEVARAVPFLASSDASYITGANLPVDGGLANF